MEGKMQVSEIFYSLQGEGMLAGVPSVFVRFTGCPLRCRWCDTKYAWQESAGDDCSLEKIVRDVQPWDCRCVVITGGEPMINPDLSARSELVELTAGLKRCGKHITIETAGIGYIEGLTCDLMSISPKLSNSVPVDSEEAKRHEELRLDTAVLGKLISTYNYQLKFVVDRESDLEEIKETLEQVGIVDPARVFLMPQVRTREELVDKGPMVAEMCKNTGYVLGQRLQVLLWNNDRGK
jgi:7-carboxy-7-deazaguanine synthase